MNLLVSYLFRNRRFRSIFPAITAMMFFAAAGAYGQTRYVDSTVIRRAYQLQMQEAQAQAAKNMFTGGGTATVAMATVALPSAYNWYVSVAGNDANAGTQAAPLRTIQAAINKSASGQSIKVADGRYVENIDFMGKSVKVVGNPNNPSAAIIDGGGRTATVKMIRRETNVALLCGFTITGGNGNASDVALTSGGGIHLFDNAKPVLSDLIITGNTGNGASAVGILHSASPTIQNTLIYGNTNINPGFVVRVANLVPDTRMYNVTIVNNIGTRSSIGISRNCRVVVKNSIIRNDGYGYEMEIYNTPDYLGSMSYATVDYCNIRSGTGLLYAVSGQGSYTLGSGIINVAPGFVDPASGKYQLSASSPCVDAGDPATTWNDVNLPPSRGTVRNDLGAYGWQVSAQPYQAPSASGIRYVYDKSGNRKERSLIVLNGNMIRAASASGSDAESFSVDEYLFDDKESIAKHGDTNPIGDLNGNYTITVYPNPTKGMLRVVVSGGDVPKGAVMMLYNAVGTLLHHRNVLSADNTLDISNQPPGTYFMRVVLDKEHTGVWKIIKE